MNKKDNKLIAKAYVKARDLAVEGFITLHLFTLLRKEFTTIGEKDVDKVKFLTRLCEDTIRVRGYFNRHKEMVQPTNEYIDRKVAEFEKERRKNE